MQPGNRTPAFDDDEYRSRQDRTKHAMATRELDALLVVEPANVNWLTGYEARSFYTPQAVLLTADGEAPLWIGRNIDTTCARWTTHLTDDQIVGYPDEYVSDASRHGFQFIAQLVTTRVSTGGVIGVECEAGTFTPRAYHELERNVGDRRLVDADGLVNRLRAVKSNAELRYMREAGQIACLGMDEARRAIQPGRRECDVIADVYRVLLRGTPAAGGDIPITPNIATGQQTDAPHLTWSDRPLRHETPVTLELAGCRHRYHAALSRTFFLGQPPAGLRDVATAVTEAYLGLLEKLRPGRHIGEAVAAWTDIAKRSGITKESRIGYSIGIGYPTASWSERTISLADRDDTVLEPNMTLHIIPAIWTPSEGGYLFSETIAIADGDPEILTTTDRGLIEL